MFSKSVAKYLLLSSCCFLSSCIVYTSPWHQHHHDHSAAMSVSSSNQIDSYNPPAWKGAAAPLSSSDKMRSLEPAAEKIKPYHEKGLNPPAKKLSKPAQSMDKPITKLNQ